MFHETALEKKLVSQVEVNVDFVFKDIKITCSENNLIFTLVLKKVLESVLVFRERRKNIKIGARAPNHYPLNSTA